MMIDNEVGLYGKYYVERLTDTTNKHKNCRYYVLDLEHDPFSVPALRAYANACMDEFPALANDLFLLANELEERWQED